MAIARKRLIDESRPGCFHLVNRYVRRASLCGGASGEHRRQWIEDRIEQCAPAFGVEVLAFAVMTNHLHLVVRTRPDLAQDWAPMAIAERWTTIYPLRNRRTCEILPPDLSVLQAWADNPAWVAEHRTRLTNLGWFMKSIKEPLARVANKEDGCTGAFWEGRFHATALLDQQAIMACMAYVDLNPIRARMADTPETSAHTSIHQRIAAREACRRRTTVQAQHTAQDAQAIIERERLTDDTHPEAGCWVAPMHHCTRSPNSDSRTTTLDDYITLVDATGRLVRDDKRGAIDPRLAPILSRLDLDLDRWLAVIRKPGSFRGSAVGDHLARAAEALRRGVRWVADRTGLHRPQATAVQTA